MNELIFKDFTHVILPSGSYLFFPSLEQRSAEKKGEWLTIVAYDAPPYSRGSRIGTTLHVGLEEGTFYQLERRLAASDLEQEPLVLRYAIDGDNELKHLELEGAALDVLRDSEIRELRPQPARASKGA